MNNFKERRDSILGVFNKAKSDLETLNVDTQDQINQNQSTISDLTAKNSELLTIKSNNESSIKTFGKLFK